MEINLKDWKKYKQQIDLFNALESERVNKLQTKANDEYRKRMDTYFEIARSSYYFRPSFIPCEVYNPKLKKGTFEEFLDWLSTGKPDFVRQLKL